MAYESQFFSSLTGQEIISKRWGAETAIYATLSGETHLLDNQSADLLQQIHRSPSSYQALKASLDEIFDLSEDGVAEEIEEYLQFTLKQLLQLGLIQISPKKELA